MAVHGPAAGPWRRARGRRLITDAALLAEVRVGLEQQQKELPSKLFYDERGSELFEEITALPEYYLTRTEQALLEVHAPSWIGEQRPRSIVELGAGNAAKTRVVLDALCGDDNRHDHVYVPVDISTDFLERTASALRSEYPGLVIDPVAADFTRSLALPPSLPRPLLLTFLGSTIGNFDRDATAALLRRLRALMLPGDRFLLGIDLRKDVATLEAAYDDARGVTAAFNLNVLRVINRRFGADFNLDAFRHRAVYNTEQHRMEMHLVSTRDQAVHIPGAGDVALARGETIRTEISCKYDRPGVEVLFTTAGLALAAWEEAPGAVFALALGAPAAT